jgi:hypothetical protein
VGERRKNPGWDPGIYIVKKKGNETPKKGGDVIVQNPDL